MLQVFKNTIVPCFLSLATKKGGCDEDEKESLF